MGEELNYIINHVFLPPHLPQKDDSGVKETNALIDMVLAASELLQNHIPEQEHSEWLPCIKMMRNMRKLKDKSGNIIAKKLKTALKEMLDGDILALHIDAQNAGLIVRRFSDRYSFESFELSPTNDAVIGTKGRLRRCFPGPAVAIGQERIADTSFLEPLAELLANLDTETPEEVCSTTKKAGSEVIEVRNTVHPRLVTEMLTGILRAVGQPLEVSRIYKHTRDDVLCKSTSIPWRRSPAWLFLRVALQTSLLRPKDKDPHRQYKSLVLFFLAYVLESARKVPLPSDMFFIMTAKISRRMLKLEMTDGNTWMDYIEKVTEAVQQDLAHRWDLLEKDPDPQGTQLNWLPSQLSFLDDTKLRIPKLRPYLAKMPARSALTSTTKHFKSDCRPRVSPFVSSLPALNFSGIDSSQTRLNLIDLELWVCRSLDDWLHTNLRQEDACTALTKVIDTYISVASSVYADEPEEISLMILTSMELWVALDKCTLHRHPLLHQYDPGFPPSLFEPLLLPKKPQMERLSRLEKYLARRKQAAVSKYPSIFQSIDSQQSFAVQYFEQSSRHQKLRQDIEADAKIKRSEKINELAKKRKEYQDMMKRVDGMLCETFTRYRRGRPHQVHNRHCQKCELKSTAERLSIDIHEWPLPQKDLQAKSAVFELHAPIDFCKWRDITYSLLVGILSIERDVPSSDRSGHIGGVMISLYDYSGLSKFVGSRAGRVHLASSTKPFTVSHYRDIPVFQASEKNICVNNGMNYRLHDSDKMKWTSELLGCCDVRMKCTLKLPAGVYEGLQFVVDSTSHTSNEVIARQAECPAALTMHEYYAFGTLRSGFRLQWRNIARELTACVLNFNRQEVNILVTQAAWQVGPISGDLYRESHVDLEEEEFGTSLLSVLNNVVDTIESNWQSVTAARTFVALASRLLSLCTCNEVRDGCCLLLRRTRAILLRWSRELGEKLQKGQEKEEELKNLSRRTLEMALTCYGTFDVDLPHLSYLIGSDEDIADATECSIIIHDRCPAVIDDLPSSIKILLRRHRRLACLLEPILREKITESRGGLDSTIGRLWMGYKPGLPWTALETPSERWLTTETSKQDDFSSMPIHYNLLDGTLLVNGSPLTRLPRSYEAHPTFHRLFGENVFDVVPSAMSGMGFEARNKFFDHQLYFGMHDSELIIRARKQEQIFELLPIHVLDGDFPHAFIQDFAHWLNIKTGLTEWRPLKDAWTSTSHNWQMRSGDRGEKFLIRDSSRIIDIHTPTAKAVSLVLSPLEDAAHIHIIFNRRIGTLEVQLPRLNLGFFLSKDSTRLESKQFRGMTVDANQSFGTLTGLVNKLVLQGDHNSGRSVIIPHGDVLFKPGDSHVSIQIKPSPQLRSYHIYQIDNQLGRLVDNGTLKSRLFKSYLHAVTAHCLTDELTGRTGTEEALYTLASSSVCSFLRLEQAEIDLLELLARLTPCRQYYPRHLQVMQQVDWETLSPLSQHDSFCTLVCSIFAKARMMDLFHEIPTQLPNLDIYTEQQDLLERAAIRNSTYRVDGFGAENHTSKHDVVYNSRDHLSDGEREPQIHHIANLVDGWSQKLKCCSHLLEEIQSWGNPLCGWNTECKFPLGYDMKWLEPVANHFPGDWCALQIALSHSIAGADKYRIMIFLSTLMYSQTANQELVRTLLAFATVSELRVLKPPQFESFNLFDGFEPDRKRLEEAAKSMARPFSSCPESELAQLSNETYAEAQERRWNSYQAALDNCIKTFVDALIRQWPAVDFHDPTGIDFGIYISVEEVTKEARKWFQSWYRNAKFKDYIGRAQVIIDNLNVGDHSLIEYSFSQPTYDYSLKRSFVDMKDIMTRPAPYLSLAPFEDFGAWTVQQQYGDHVDHKTLEAFVNGLLSESKMGFEQRYAKDLLKSFESLQSVVDTKLSGSSQALKPLLQFHLTRCINYVESVYHTICACLQAESSVTRRLASKSKMWPRLSTMSLLQHLAGGKGSHLRDDWRDALITYGLAISTLQRAERLLNCAGNDLELLNELNNPGHQGWDTSQYPDWLLLEVENNLLIRQAQAKIALEMISPSSGANSILQLNMGEGKSSVIVPIVATALADKKKLVRVVVLKPLSTQMFHLLLRKLGGLLNRRIFHMPFSRSLKLNLQNAEKIQTLCKECMDTGGILLIQPEHLLSMELIGPERLLAGDTLLGNKLFKIQQWLEQNSRDVLDESDEILSVRFELIYTMGTQRAIEFSPNRWTIVEHVLGLVSRFTQPVLQNFPHGLELRSVCVGSFPRLRILQPSAANKLLGLIAKHVCNAGLPGVPVWNLSEDMRNVLYRYLTDPSIIEADIEPLQDILRVDTMRRSLLLLKGLIADGVLAFSLQLKRWRVNYGLDLSRTMLAIPYRAKDIPAARAEFSHPDATIVLTCLSYYQGGLSDEQMYTAFERLLLCDHAQEEYEQWVQDAHHLPPTFRQLTGINLSDLTQCSEIVFPALRLAKSVIDFYLSQVVFPKEMKEFPEKLSSSGWDIGRAKVHPITGFSGTNDSRYVLPLSVGQCDLPSQSHTNAAVLGCLLRPENSFKHTVQKLGSETLDEELLLQMVTEMEPPVRVILDVGAQVLEWKNEEIARRWLSRVPESDAQAVVFFNDCNDLSVLSRDGTIESLINSPFAKQMDQCLVYLDEAHTRGTDLKLPSHYRAAVTLGPDLTKDRLVQACMRMRKLGKGQSVVFCGPLEVERKILDCCGKTPGDTIEVADVLRWSISETCISTKKCIPLWGTQGIRHLRHHIAKSEFSNGDDTGAALDVAKALLETEAQSLEDRYGLRVRRHEEQVLLHNLKGGSLSKCEAQVDAMRAKCREFGLSTFNTATLREEQERELSPENERERQVERPPALTPYEHSIHPDLKLFVHQGFLDHRSEAFQPAFELFSNTSAVECLEKNTWSSNFWVTVDFARTVQISNNQCLDSYLRPVHWVASGKSRESLDLVVLSPYEAHELLPSIRQHKAITLHVYSPRVSMSVGTLEDLSFCAVPSVSTLRPRPSLIIQLNIFAGQLYLKNYEDYLSVCRFLGLCYRPPEGQNRVACDGFITLSGRSNFDAVMERECPFTISPIGFLRILMTLRRKGQGFAKSHYGRILNGELLTQSHFLEQRVSSGGSELFTGASSIPSRLLSWVVGDLNIRGA